MSITNTKPPQTMTLIATGSGTAMASVCAVGLLQIEQTLGGIGAVAAISIAGLLCLVLARALARLTIILPSGAGLMAFLSRAFGRPVGILVVVPYLLLMLLLVGFEALIVGELVARLLPIPVIVTAVGFLVLTWSVCRAGIQVGYLAQAVTTWALFACLTGISVVALSRFTYALASQGLLPRQLAQLESRTLTARPALRWLLGLTVSFTVIIYLLSWYQAVILAAAIAAALVYAAVLWARERVPFRESERTYHQQLMSAALALSLVGLGIGVIVTAENVRQSTILLLVMAYGIAALLLLKRHHKQLQPTPVRRGKPQHAN